MQLPQLRTTDMAATIAQAKFIPEEQATGDEVYCTYKPYIGDYLVGRDQESLTDEEVLVVIDTLAVGWILWHNRTCYEEFVPFIDSLPHKPAFPVDIADECVRDRDDWVEARGLMFVTDDGMNVVWKASTMGMRKAVDPLIQEIIQRASVPGDNDFLYPRVKLKVAKPYTSKKGGDIYNPELEIVSWHDKDGNVQSAIEEKPQTRRRRKSA